MLWRVKIILRNSLFINLHSPVKPLKTKNQKLFDVFLAFVFHCMKFFYIAAVNVKENLGISLSQSMFWKITYLFIRWRCSCRSLRVCKGDHCTGWITHWFPIHSGWGNPIQWKNFWKLEDAFYATPISLHTLLFIVSFVSHLLFLSFSCTSVLIFMSAKKKHLRWEQNNYYYIFF